MAETNSCAVKTTITAARTKNRLVPNFDVNVFDFIGMTDGEVYLAYSWQRAFHSGVKNDNEVPAQCSSLAHK